MKTYSLDQIKSALEGVDLMSLIEEGFVAYSDGRSVVPPVGDLVFNNPPAMFISNTATSKETNITALKLPPAFMITKNWVFPAAAV